MHARERVLRWLGATGTKQSELLARMRSEVPALGKYSESTLSRRLHPKTAKERARDFSEIERIAIAKVTGIPLRQLMPKELRKHARDLERGAA